jgi:hypothetical protein
MALRTEFQFTLPRGYVDKDGNLHKEGVMRLATAADEIHPMKDMRVRSNQAYLAVILLSRVITKLGTLTEVTPSVIEGLFSADLSYLQEFYRQINENGVSCRPVTCPECSHKFEVDISCSGG